MQFPLRHFSLKAHSWSAWHTGRHILSLQVLPSEQSELDSQETGTKNDWQNTKVLWILQTKKFRIFLSVTCQEAILTSHAFYIMISSEPRRTTALFVVIKHSTFSIHSTCRALVTRIVTLSLQTLICQATLFIWLTRCWNVTHNARKVKCYHQD